MLDRAVKAVMPIIQIRSTDPLNTKAILRYYFPEILAVTGVVPIINNPDTHVGYTFKELTGTNLRQAYEQLLDSGNTLIMVNPKVDISLAFNAGDLTAPKGMILQQLEEGGFEGRKAKKLLPSLSNLNLKQIGEVCRFAQVQYGELTPHAVSMVKREIYPESRGLIQVDTQLDFYFPNDKLSNLLEDERWFFLECKDHRLIPRGVLLYGDAGVGKSQAAKYFANQWGVPLFLLDLSSIMGKYVGESEKGMMAMLSRIDAEAPAIILLDEIEKLFTSDGESGTTSRLLGQLLWWLAEKRSRVYVIMTSNNIELLPKELYRPGRIDEVLKLEGLPYVESKAFAKRVLAKFDDNLEAPSVDQLFKDPINNPKETASHAALVQVVKTHVKQHLIVNQEA